MKKKTSSTDARGKIIRVGDLAHRKNSNHHINKHVPNGRVFDPVRPRKVKDIQGDLVRLKNKWLTSDELIKE